MLTPILVAVVTAFQPTVIPAGETHHTSSCRKTFTARMLERAVDATFAGTRTVPSRGWGRLRRYERCARPGVSRARMRRYEKNAIAAWKLRRHPPAPPEPATGLAECIIQRESGGNPQAVNGQYEGLAQWSPTSWIGGGGGRYAPTPLGASYGEQVTILNQMLADGQSGQWTPYDGC